MKTALPSGSFKLSVIERLLRCRFWKSGPWRHLDLDAVGAPVGEIAHGGRAGAHPRQIEHGKAGKRSCGHGLTLGWNDYSTRTMAAGSISSQTRLPISKTVLGPVETRSGLA